MVEPGKHKNKGEVMIEPDNLLPIGDVDDGSE
jgi:hypothetical protein